MSLVENKEGAPDPLLIPVSITSSSLDASCLWFLVIPRFIPLPLHHVFYFLRMLADVGVCTCISSLTNTLARLIFTSSICLLTRANEKIKEKVGGKPVMV